MTNSMLRQPLETNFLVIAHRGASRYAPENTMSAFKKAVQMGADMIELDVQLSMDGVPVVFHDSHLERHSNGRGLISSLSFDELQKLDAGGWYSEEYRKEKIPSLREVLEWAAEKIMVNIEIKPEAVGDLSEGGVEKNVVQLVRETGMLRHVIISCFDYRAVKRIKKIDPQILTGLLYNRNLSGKLGPVELLNIYDADFFHCSKTEIGKKWIRQLQEGGKRYLIYTVNKKKQMRRWIESGAFGIFSDRPDRLRTVSDEIFSNSA